MANPQKKDGNTGINNKVLENLYRSGLNGTELSICLMILRKTWGWNKLTDEISLSQFESEIPSSRKSICTALNNLQLVKIITLVKKGSAKNSSNEYKFNKDYDSWQLVKKSKLVKPVKKTTLVTSEENFTHNINSTKKNKNISKDILKEKNDLFECYWSKYPRKVGKGKSEKSFSRIKQSEMNNFDIAFNYYIESVKGRDIQYIKQGSAFFNQWKDIYIESQEQKMETKQHSPLKGLKLIEAYD